MDAVRVEMTPNGYLLVFHRRLHRVPIAGHTDRLGWSSLLRFRILGANYSYSRR